MSWLGTVRQRAAERPAALALSTGRADVTYRALVGGSLPPAAPGELVALHGDPVAVLGGFVAARRAGAVPLVLDARWSAQQREDALARFHGPPRDPGGLAVLTSGSTRAPRGVLRSEASWTASFAALAELTGLTDADEVLVPVPLSASLGLFAAVHALACGAALLSPAGPGELLALARRATVVHTTPHGLERVLDALAGAPSRRLRCAIVGGAALAPALRERSAAAGIRVLEYYGAAELSFVGVDGDGDGLRAFPGVQVRIEGGGGAPGRIWVRSPYLADGYLGDTGALRRDADGWVTVGDLGALLPGAPGRFAVRGRGDAAILTAAATVLAEDVERVLSTFPGIGAAVVFGEPHPALGALVCAAVETAAGDPDAAARRWREACRSALPSEQRPRRWYTAARLPRTASGKPDRGEVVRRARAGRLRRSA